MLDSSEVMAASRRHFLKLSAATGAAATVLGSTLPFKASAAAATPAASDEKTVWSGCMVNCGRCCPLQLHVKDDVVTKVTTHDEGEEVPGQYQVRACLRGRSVRGRLYNPDRLKYPMKRVGKRGEGRFERISWDEALNTVTSELKRIISTYGNEAVYFNYGTGTIDLNVSGRNASRRFLRAIGGHLNYHNNYSNSQIHEAMIYTFGDHQGTYFEEIKNSDLVVFFGINTAETRMGGGGQNNEISVALQKSNARCIIIDPRRTDTTICQNAEWLPIRPGTDAALVEGMAYVLISENLVDKPFLDEFCVGYDSTTLPEGTPESAGYRAWILGEGEDGVAKTPAWASSITGIPEKTIIQLARAIGTARAPFIAQGWGIQRSAAGEQASRSIFMLPILTGNIGKPGTNVGNWPGSIDWASSYPLDLFSAGDNPVKTSIPCYLWADAIAHPEKMTDKTHYVLGKEKLDTGIKFMWNYASNMLVNQHSNSGRNASILSDESLCEFVLVIDNHMTPSARFADLLLPDVTHAELDEIVNSSYAGTNNYLIKMEPATKPMWECRPIYDICADLAKRFGVEEQYTHGRTRSQWTEHFYDLAREKNPKLPPMAEARKQGVVGRSNASPKNLIAYKAFREDPKANPLKTASGKIEIWSAALQKRSEEWILPEGDVISALPKYVVTWDSHLDKTTASKYPLQMIGFHTKGRTHSTYHNVPNLREAVPDEIWINPVDAKNRQINVGDMVEVFNDRGRIQVAAKVTDRILPGVTAMPQGAWYKPDRNGVDRGSCINTLTSERASPLAKANPQHTNLVEIKLASKARA